MYRHSPTVRLHRLLTALLIGALLASAAGPSAAQVAGTPSAQELAALESRLRTAAAGPQSGAQLDLGLFLAQTGRAEEAWEYLEPWVAAHPDDDDARLAASICALQLRRFDEAQGLLAALPADQVHGTVLRGKLAVLLEEPDRAIELLRPLLGQIDSIMEADVRRTLANAYMMTDQAAAAIELLEGAKEPSIALLLGKAKSAHGNYVGAIDTLAPLLGSVPESMDRDLRRTLADAYIHAGRAAEVIPLLEGRADQPALVMALAEARYQTGDVAGALETLRPWAESTVQKPASGDSNGRLAAVMVREYGRYLSVSGQSEMAIPYLEYYTQVTPDDREGWQALAQALGAAGRTDEARAAVSRLSQADKPTAVPTDRLSAAYAALSEGRTADAVAILEDLRRRTELPPPGAALLGTLYVDSGRPEEAWQILAPLAREEGNPAVLYQAGRAAVGTGRVDDGVALLERSVALESNTPASRELGLLYGRLGRIGDAYRLLRPWAMSNPDDAEVRLAAASCAVRLRRLDAAEELLATLPQSEPRIQLLWAKLQLIRGEPFSTISTLSPLVTADDNALQSDIRHTLAEAHLEIGESDRALELLEGRTLDDPAVALKLGEARYQAGDVAGAIAAVEPFATRILARTDLEVGSREGARVGVMLREMGRFLVGDGRHEEALPYIQRATELRADDRQAWQTLGQTLAAAGRTEEAMAAVQRFQELAADMGSVSEANDREKSARENPTEWAIYEAGRLADEGSFDEALERVRDEASMTPEDPRLRLFESRILLMASRPDDALAVASTIVAQFPQVADSYYQRGVVHLALERYELAERDLRAAIELDGKHLPAMNDLAVLLIVRGRRDEAKALLRRALELRPDDPQATATLQRLEGAPS